MKIKFPNMNKNFATAKISPSDILIISLFLNTDFQAVRTCLDEWVSETFSGVITNKHNKNIVLKARMTLYKG